jgi:hypothetical protein
MFNQKSKYMGERRVVYRVLGGGEHECKTLLGRLRRRLEENTRRS